MRIIPKYAILALLTSVCTSICSQNISFVNISDSLSAPHDYGISPIQSVTYDLGGGVSFCDFDRDGRDDLVLSSARSNAVQVYRNNGSSFVQVTLPGTGPDTFETKQVLWADYDNDGDRDLFLCNLYASPTLYRNDDSTFTDVTAFSGINTDPLESFGAAWGDYDLDGLLDLYIAVFDLNSGGENFLYHNNGNGTFTDVSFAAGIQDSGSASFQAGFLDYDRDGWPDIYVANDRLDGNTLFRNLGNGTFQDVSVSSGAGLAMYAMCVAVGDYDGNGFPDIYVTNTDIGNRLLQNQGNGTFVEKSAVLGVEVKSICWGANFLDADNDGDDDLYVGAAMDTAGNWVHNPFFENDGAGGFIERTGIGLDDARSTMGTATGDIDGDGYPDLVAANGKGSWSQLYRNNGGSNHWIRIDLEGVQSNRDGIGVSIEAVTDSFRVHRYTMCGESMISQSSFVETIGMGTDSMLDLLVLTWPSGITDSLKNIPSRQLLHVTEGMGTLSANDSVTHVSCNGDSNGVITLSPTGGNGNYQYAWSTGDSSASLSGMPAGTYSLTLSSGFACKTYNFFVGEPAPVPQPSITPSGSLLVSSPAVSYAWFLNGNTIPGATAQTFAPVTTGQYQVQITDANGCPAISDPYGMTVGLISPLEMRIAWAAEGEYILYMPTEEATITVIGLNGAILRQTIKPQGAVSAKLDLRDLAHGIYVLELHLPQGRIIRKVLR